MNLDQTQVFKPTEKLVSWGRVVRAPHRIAKPAYPDELDRLISSLTPEEPGLAIGLRRSYGDSNLNPNGAVIDMTGLDAMIAFDRETGVIRAEAGVSLSQCLQVLVPAGYFLPTTPGTRFVTLGGAVANDVHGKNHHSAGTFGASVTRLSLRRSDAEPQILEPGDALFHATIGGLGLTGVIDWVEFQAARIPSAYLDAEDIAFANVNDYFDLMKDRAASYEHSMAWIDCLAGGDNLGRGVLSCANWSDKGRLKPHRENPRLALPLDAPGFALNTVSVKAFNAAFNALKKTREGASHPHYQSFLYPLDSIADWNRMYGSKGFYQYQCVIPVDAARDGAVDILQAIAASGQGSFLAVLKDFGPAEPVGLLSFPMEGTTLALDFPNKGETTLRLMSKLDDIVKQTGGRLYPAKDGRISADMFQSGYPQWEGFRQFVDPVLSSGFWKRVSQ